MKDHILRLLPFYRWHPEVAIRYLPIVKEINKLGEVSILEVGSGGLGIAPYLNRPVTGVDDDFSGPHHPLLKMIKGVGEKLPFENNSFDVVISVDTLEHVPPKNRAKVISELARVAKKELILAFPSGLQSLEQDKLLSKIYQQKYGKEFPFLSEHLKYGLPENGQVVAQLKSIFHAKVTTHEEGNENLKLRRFLMTGWMTKNRFIDIFYRKLLLPFSLLFAQYNAPPLYRTIIYAKIN